MSIFNSFAALASGGGLEYETGKFTPTSSTYTPVIPFAKTHTTLPMCVIIQRAGATTNTMQKTVHLWWFLCWELFSGNPMYPSSSISYTGSYGKAGGGYYRKTSDTSLSSMNEYNLTQSVYDEGASSGAYPRYHVTESQITPNTSAQGAYFRNIEYEWIAIWAPEN